jgi:hypothetical protein
MVRGLESALEAIKARPQNSTKVIMLLLSNTGGTAINKAVFQHLSGGFSRSDLELNQLKEVILADEFATWHSSLYQKGLIDHIVPFLPLEFDHVVKCIAFYLRQKGVKLSKNIVIQIAKEFEYFPAANPLFSKTGCKLVHAKTDLFLE